MAKRDERFLNECDWLAALSKRDTPSAARILPDLVCNGSLPSRGGRLDSLDFGKKLSAFMTSHEQFRREVYERFPSVEDAAARSVLEYAIAVAADPDGVLLLTREGAAKEKHFRATALYTALRNEAEEKFAELSRFQAANMADSDGEEPTGAKLASRAQAWVVWDEIPCSREP